MLLDNIRNGNYERSWSNPFCGPNLKAGSTARVVIGVARAIFTLAIVGLIFEAALFLASKFYKYTNKEGKVYQCDGNTCLLAKYVAQAEKIN